MTDTTQKILEAMHQQQKALIEAVQFQSKVQSGLIKSVQGITLNLVKSEAMSADEAREVHAKLIAAIEEGVVDITPLMERYRDDRP
ncbi:MAG: hypothetical protein GY700_06570 [Propionibacteriaceae bacterium]|nr:hypothetical protein [Propionibacteriaceae bacterium]